MNLCAMGDSYLPQKQMSEKLIYAVVHHNILESVSSKTRNHNETILPIVFGKG